MNSNRTASRIGQAPPCGGQAAETQFVRTKTRHVHGTTNTRAFSSQLEQGGYNDRSSKPRQAKRQQRSIDLLIFPCLVRIMEVDAVENIFMQRHDATCSGMMQRAAT